MAAAKIIRLLIVGEVSRIFDPGSCISFIFISQVYLGERAPARRDILFLSDQLLVPGLVCMYSCILHTYARLITACRASARQSDRTCLSNYVCDIPRCPPGDSKGLFLLQSIFSKWVSYQLAWRRCASITKRPWTRPKFTRHIDTYPVPIQIITRAPPPLFGQH